jgi:hypothetical protein
MANRRITVRVDAKMEEILKKHRSEGEAEGACIERLAKQVHDIAVQLEMVNLRAERSYEDTKKLLTEFLNDVKQPFEQITEHLESINEKIGGSK